MDYVNATLAELVDLMLTSKGEGRERRWLQKVVQEERPRGAAFI